jgi:hypothetical protein
MITFYPQDSGHQVTTITITDVQEAEIAASEIRQLYFGVIGFDTETSLNQNKRNAPVDLIQIYLELSFAEVRKWTSLSKCDISATSNHMLGICFLFHIGQWNLQHRTDFPPSLAKIIRSKQHMKAISAPENDAKWLSEDFGITMAGYIDIQTIAVQLGHHKTGLDALASNYLSNWQTKSKCISKSNWKAKLTLEMIKYAAYDAYASYHVFMCMFPSFGKSCLTTEKCPKTTHRELFEKLPRAADCVSYQELMRRCNTHLWPKDMHPRTKLQRSGKMVDIWLAMGLVKQVGQDYVY